MKKSPITIALLVCVILSGCSSVSRETELKQELAASVDQLCTWTGLKRAGALKTVDASSSGYYVSVPLSVDGVVKDFDIGFSSKKKMEYFQPHNLNLTEFSESFRDTKHVSSKTKRMCVAALNKLNQWLHWTWYGDVNPRRCGSNYALMFETVSEEEQKKSGYMYLDPYVHFWITPRGTVFGIHQGM